MSQKGFAKNGDTNDDDVLSEGEKFKQTYPTSDYYDAINSMQTSANQLKRLPKR